MSSSSSSKPLQFNDIDCSQMTISDFKPNKTRESNLNSYISWSETQQRNVQLPLVTAVAGVKRFEGKIDKASGRQEKASIGLLFPLRLKSNPQDKLVFDKANAMWERVVDLIVEKEGLPRMEVEFKLNKLVSFPLDEKKKPKLDQDPSLKIKFPFDDTTNSWFMNTTRLQGREVKTPSIVFQQLVWDEGLQKKTLRDRPDITPANVCDEIPKMSVVRCLVSMNQLTFINARYTWPVKVTRVVFELPKHDDLEMDLGDDVVVQPKSTSMSQVAPPQTPVVDSSVKPSLLQQLAALNQSHEQPSHPTATPPPDTTPHLDDADADQHMDDADCYDE